MKSQSEYTIIRVTIYTEAAAMYLTQISFYSYKGIWQELRVGRKHSFLTDTGNEFGLTELYRITIPEEVIIDNSQTL